MGIAKNIYFFGQTPIEGTVHIPLQETCFIDPKIDLNAYDFLIVTSKRSIQSLQAFDYNLQQLPLYTVGKKTAAFALSEGLNVVHQSLGYAKDLITEIKPKIAGKKGLYLRPKRVANSYITAEVSSGVLDEAICYETRCKKADPGTVQHPAVLLFAAPSQITCFLEQYTFDAADVIVVIGTTTAEAVPNGYDFSISDEPTMESLMAKAKLFL